MSASFTRKAIIALMAPKETGQSLVEDAILLSLMVTVF
jgi:hypothetical protein